MFDGKERKSRRRTRAGATDMRQELKRPKLSKLYGEARTRGPWTEGVSFVRVRERKEERRRKKDPRVAWRSTIS